MIFLAFVLVVFIAVVIVVVVVDGFHSVVATPRRHDDCKGLGSSGKSAYAVLGGYKCRFNQAES